MDSNNIKKKWIIEYNKNNNDEYKGFVFTGKYLAILLPNHPMARSDGYVYIHQLQAEKIINRHLRKGECVHHINENKYDNDLDNLMVFKTIADHTAFHMGADIYLDDDVWVAKSNIDLICPICGTNKKERDAKMCKSCYLEQCSLNIPEKEELIELLLSYPMTKIGEKFNVSDNAVRKWCQKYNLPHKRNDIISFRKSYSI